MILFSSIIKQFETDFLDQYRGKILPSHFKALGNMKLCRTAASPRMLASCTECNQQAFVPHSCGHRNCPHCQSHESQQWLERQLKKQVPAEYFLLTFTLPAQLRSLAWQHQRIFYGLIMQSAWETLHSFSLNDKELQGTPGAIAVLHTHSRELAFHPHVHLVMPAAAINAKSRLWRKKSKGKAKKSYLFNHKALAKVFRAKMLDGISKAGLALPGKYPEKWVVNCKAVGSGEKALIYLGQYLYKGVIQEKDIVTCNNGKVTFRYRNSKTKELKLKTVSGAQFLWLVLQHVLPRGFRRARNFGFLHPNSKRLIQLLQFILKIDPARGLEMLKQRPQMICTCCGAKMKIIKTMLEPLFSLHAALPT
jgi:hypothetical protein